MPKDSFAPFDINFVCCWDVVLTCLDLATAKSYTPIGDYQELLSATDPRRGRVSSWP